MTHTKKSTVLESGYINVYSHLSAKEKRQLSFKRQFRSTHPDWDESQVLLAKRFSQLVSPHAVVLDAGCGNGNYILDENQHLIKKSVGVDVDAAYTTHNSTLDQIIFGNLEQLPFADRTFDAIVSLWVLEHLENPARVFVELHRVLKPGACLFFVTPNKDYLPLKIIATIKSRTVNYVVNALLFGRKKEDIFPTYYRANRVDTVMKQTAGLFSIESLLLNFDPSYTSFNTLTYGLTTWLHRVLPSPLWSSHLIAILRKK